MAKRFIFVAVVFSVTVSGFAQSETEEKPCILDLKNVTQQAHLWPGLSKKTKSRGWMVQKFLKTNSFYEKIGLLIGDIILEVNGVKTNPSDPKDPAIADLYNIQGNKPNKIIIERDGATESVIFTCPYR